MKHRFPRFVFSRFVVPTLLLAAVSAYGATFQWANTSGNWNDPANWGGVSPSGLDATDILSFGGNVGLLYVSTNNLAPVPALFNQLVFDADNTGNSPDALDRLAASDPRKADLVKLRYFVRLSFEEAAEVLGISVRTAQKGIIHRNLKPSNILVTLHDGVPVPKVINSGVAKATQQQRLTDLTIYTQFEQMIGTPLYMSPEQAERKFGGEMRRSGDRRFELEVNAQFFPGNLGEFGKGKDLQDGLE